MCFQWASAASAFSARRADNGPLCDTPAPGAAHPEQRIRVLGAIVHVLPRFSRLSARVLPPGVWVLVGRANGLGRPRRRRRVALFCVFDSQPALRYTRMRGSVRESKAFCSNCEVSKMLATRVQKQKKHLACCSFTREADALRLSSSLFSQGAPLEARGSGSTDQ